MDILLKKMVVDTIDVNRALEALMVLQPKPPICWKVATIAPVVRIPKWKRLMMPVNVKDAQKEDGVPFLVSQKSPPASIVVLESMDKTVRALMLARRVPTAAKGNF